jgi:molybdopterin/thiamine biosynthesis adenylyltransferase
MTTANTETALDPVFARNPVEAAALRERHIAIVGLGSGGSAVALMAARAGVGRFTLVDPDVLSLENVGRHMLMRDSVGMSKVRGVERAIKNINPSSEVRAFPVDFKKLSRGDFLGVPRPDILVGATDSLECESVLNAMSLEEGIPAVYGGAWGGGSVGEILYVVPGRTPCLECVFGFRRETEQTSAGDPRKYTDPEFDGTRVLSQAGLWPSIVQTASVAFNVILGLLLPDSAFGRHFIDCERTLLFLNVSAFDAPLQPLAVTAARPAKGCAVCQPTKLHELGRDLGHFQHREILHDQAPSQPIAMGDPSELACPEGDEGSRASGDTVDLTPDASALAEERSGDDGSPSPPLGEASPPREIHLPKIRWCW